MKNGIQIASIDLYNGERNEGMRCIRDIVTETADKYKAELPIQYASYESRLKGELPKLDKYDIFISSGGPGSPFEDKGNQWEADYFKLIEGIVRHNAKNPEQKKYIFFICHSFQLMARYFEFAEVNERFKKSFGIWEFLKTADAVNDSIFELLPDPFFAADFRQFQVVSPNQKIIDSLGAKILAVEKPHPDGHESAIMAIRISDEIVGTQFHPEADPESMIYHFKQTERKQYIMENFGESKYFEMLASLEDQNKMQKTRSTVLPMFLQNAVEQLIETKVLHDS